MIARERDPKGLCSEQRLGSEAKNKKQACQGNIGDQATGEGTWLVSRNNIAPQHPGLQQRHVTDALGVAAYSYSRNATAAS